MEAKSIISSFFLQHQGIAIRTGRRVCGVDTSSGVNLRKTARGASSPAKPALHIPELCNVLATSSQMIISSRLEDLDGASGR
jgi:hypothetical protein